jgi:RNA polymerase sigma factor (sigma-70 family)
MPNAHLCRGPAAAPWATSLRPTDRQLLDQFSAGRNEEAFAELVRRHGPMVLGVCRRVLGDGHAAEDAFQATFLLLVRKSGTLREPDLLASWLYGVACRTSMKARARASRQRKTEQRADAMVPTDPSLDVTMRELQTLLDEELDALPEKYRAPLVLCYLEGKTNLQAARELGWPAGSISRRVARGLELLRSRLTRRGVTVSALALALLMSQEAAAAAVPASLAASTAHAAALVAAGQTAAQAASASVAELADEVLQATSFWDGARLGAAALALLAFLGGAWMWTHTPAAASNSLPASAGAPACSGGGLPPATLLEVPHGDANASSACAAASCPDSGGAAARCGATGCSGAP